jgi:pyruvate formate lyase activating enzyme
MKGVLKMDNLTACIFNIQKYSIHDGPGIRTVVFFKGCPLQCLWCSNPESQNGSLQIALDNTVYGEFRSLNDIMKEIMKDKDFYEESNGGVTLSGGEVLMQHEFAIALLKRLKEQGIHTACETAGYTSSDIFSDFIINVDLLLFDMKHYDSKKHYEATKVHNERIISNLKTAIIQGKEVIIRIPVIPDINSSLEDAEGFCSLLEEVGATKVNLLPFHQFGQKKYTLLNKMYQFANVPQLHEEDLQEYKNIFLKNGFDCSL